MIQTAPACPFARMHDVHRRLHKTKATQPQAQAKIHVLVVPKQHICCANKIDAGNSGAVAAVFEAIPKIAKQLGIISYRVINNCGEKAGQSVLHLHFHLLYDEKLGAKIV